MIKAKFEMFIKCPHCGSIILKESFDYNVIGGGGFSNVNLISFLRKKKEYFALTNIVYQIDNNTYFEKKYKCKECNTEINITYENKENIFNLLFLSSYCDYCHKHLGSDIYENIDTDDVFNLDDFTERHNIYSSENDYNKTICLPCFENEDMERKNINLSNEDDEKNEEDDPMETIQNNIPIYIKNQIMEGDKNSIIKAKVLAQLAILGLSLSDPDELDAEITLIRKNMEKNNFEEDMEDWDDPNTYANCSDWEDEPENCYHCADDECPMNKG